jgi:hypothetical protein
LTPHKYSAVDKSYSLGAQGIKLSPLHGLLFHGIILYVYHTENIHKMNIFSILFVKKKNKFLLTFPVGIWYLFSVSLMKRRKEGLKKENRKQP